MFVANKIEDDVFKITEQLLEGSELELVDVTYTCEKDYYLRVFIDKEGRTVEHCFFEKTDVCMYPLKEEEIDRYIQSGDPMDKAGSYGIQGRFAIHIKEIRGDYNNVVGLPVARLYQELQKLGVSIWEYR